MVFDSDVNVIDQLAAVKALKLVRKYGSVDPQALLSKYTEGN